MFVVVKKQKEKSEDEIHKIISSINFEDLSDLEALKINEFHRVTRGGPLVEGIEEEKPKKKVKEKKFTLMS